jgi:hypothetical protein
MHSKRALRVILISSVLFLGSFLSTLLFIPSVSADSLSGETTFYFTNALSYNAEGDLDFSFIPVSLDKPKAQNDLKYPPCILRKNNSKTIIKYEINSEDLINWVGTWSLYFLSDLFKNYSGINDFLEFFEFLSPHPYRIVEGYENIGNETVLINGDVVFDLYFSSYPRQNLRKKYRDEVNVGIYSSSLLTFSTKKIKNITQEIVPGSVLQNGISKQKIILENVNFSLNPGENILFSIEFIQKNKTRKIGNFFKNLIDEERVLNNLEKLAIKWENKSGTKENISLILKDLMPLIKELNFTIDDIAKFLDTFRSSSLVYASESHPSSVTVDFFLPGGSENTKQYYLHTDNIMDTNEPINGNGQKDSLTNTNLIWEGPSLNDRNKIIKDVSVELYLQYLKFLNPGKIEIAATLFDEDKIISGPVIKSLDRSNIFAQVPTIFIFTDINKELFYQHNLRIGIALANGSKSGLRKVNLLYDSSEKPSSVKVTFKETDNIKFNYISDPIDALIVPGESVKYTINITSKLDDVITLNVIDDKEGDWDITFIQNQLTISAGETVKTHIFVNSTNKMKEAYGDIIDLTIIVRGKTGIDRKVVSVEVSETAINYDVNIVNYTKSKYAKKGENCTFYFIIENNNTGADDDVDSYSINAVSKNDWNVKSTATISNLGRKKTTDSDEILVIVQVPKNTTRESDTITFTVASNLGNATASVNVTINVIGPDLLENIYEFFESASSTLGLDEVFGTYGPIALVSILMIIILFIIIIVVLLLTKKFVNLVCIERVKEIDPNDSATFKIVIENPTQKTKTYEISVDRNPISSKWERSIEPETITVRSHQRKEIVVTVYPTDLASPNDWIETKIKATVLGTRKSNEITTMTMVKEGGTLLKIIDVFTWPKDFKKGDRIITSFKVENKGSISAKNVKVFLYINDKEKNKVVVTIPAGGYADIKMPWIAQKGKNNMYIQVREQ